MDAIELTALVIYVGLLLGCSVAGWFLPALAARWLQRRKRQNERP